MPDPDNWQARMGAAIKLLDEAAETGDKAPAKRALEIVTQLLAEAVVLDAARPPALEPYPRCTHLLREAGKPYPRTCQECGLGPCARGRT